MTKKKSKKGKYKRAKKIVLGILLAYIAVLAIVYAAGVFYYSSRFVSGSRINGMDCSGMTVEEVERQIKGEIETYQLILKEREEKTESIRASEISMEYIEDDKIQQLKQEQNPFAWFLSFASDKDYTMSATTSYDKDAVLAAVDALACFQEENIQAPQDAHLEVTENGYEIIPEVQGNTLDKEKVREAVMKAIETGETQLDLDEAGCYINPSVYSTDESLAKAKENGEKLLSVTVTIDFSDRRETVDQNVMKDWLTVGENGEVDLDAAKVREYVQNLKYEYDTFGLSREFRTADGKTITVSGGDYGWLIAPNDTTAKIIEAVKSGESQTIEPEYTYRGYCRDTNDIGNTYVEISIEQQHLWFFKDGQLVVETDVVTGCHNKGWDTKTGVYAIMYKEREAMLVGEDYETPVDYWMPFYANVGIHDINRTVFGGTEYINNGSHGCVNTPHENAEKIYNNIEPGVPVVVY